MPDENAGPPTLGLCETVEFDVVGRSLIFPFPRGGLPAVWGRSG